MKQNVTMVKTYDFIFSVGAACSCSSTLRVNGLQKASYPLDWLYGSNFSKRVDMLLSGFERFIEQGDLSYAHAEVSIKCDAYYNEYNGITFNHDFPAGVPLAESHQAVREKYDRRIARLFRSIDEARSVLVVYIEVPSSHEAVEDADIMAAANRLRARYPDKELDVLYLRTDMSLPYEECHQEELACGVTRVTANYKSKNPEAVHYAVNADFLSRLFRAYRLKLPLSYRIKRAILRPILLLLSKNHPNREARERLRTHYHRL